MNEPRDIVERLRERDEFTQAAAHLRIDPDDLIYRDAAAEIMSLRPRVAELEAAQQWQPWPAPKDGAWVIALVNDGCQTIRVSWGNDRHGEPNWCSTDRSYGDGLFKAWIAWPASAALAKGSGGK